MSVCGPSQPGRPGSWHYEGVAHTVLLAEDDRAIRNALERPEAMDTGSIIITGLDSEIIAAAVAQVVGDFEEGRSAPVPTDYTIANTSQRVVRLILGTARLSHRWHGLDIADA